MIIISTLFARRTSLHAQLLSAVFLLSCLVQFVVAAGPLPLPLTPSPLPSPLSTLPSTTNDPCLSTCRFHLCNPAHLSLSTPADKPVTSAICLDGNVIGVANSGELLIQSRSNESDLVLASQLGLPSHVIKTFSLPNSSAAIGHQVLSPSMRAVLNDRCIVLPLLHVQLPSSENLNSDQQPLIDCVAVSTYGMPTTSASPAVTPNPWAFFFDSKGGVQLNASEFEVRLNSTTFIPPSNNTSVSGDPGWPPNSTRDGYQTLEITWYENNIEMRVSIYIEANMTHWNVFEIRTYNGKSPGGWIYMYGPFATTLLNETFRGDTIAGSIYIKNASLRPFIPPKSSCVIGVGTPGNLVLDRTDEQPVSAVKAPSLTGSVEESDDNSLDSIGFSQGYAFTVIVRDAVSCQQLFELQNIVFRSIFSNASVAKVDELTFSPDWAYGELYVSITFVDVGESILTLRAEDKSTGQLRGSLNVPVSFTTES